MVPGALTSDGGAEILGFDRRLVVVASLVVLVGVGAATAMFVLGGDGHESNAQLDSVPAGVDGVLYADGELADDEFTLDMLDEGIEVGWWFVDSSQAPDTDVILETLDTEGIAYENTTVFLRGPEDGEPDYAGSVVNLGEGSESEDVLALLEDEVGAEQLEPDSYNGVDIHELDVVAAAEQADVEGVTDAFDVTSLLTEFIGVETTAWVATPDEDTVILGSEAAAADAIDVYQGDADPFEGDLRETHERLEPGPVEATVSPALVDRPITEIAGVVSSDVATMLSITNEDPEFLGLTYEPRDREQGIATFDVIATMSDSGAASDLMEAMEQVADPEEALEDPEAISEESAVDRAAGHQDGRYIHLEVPTMPDQAATYIAHFVDRYATPPDPVELVPERADGIVNIDGNGSGGFAEALAAESEDWSVEEVSAVIQAEETGGSLDDVEYHSATTFYSEDDDGYVATYLEVDVEAEEFIDSHLGGAYREATGGQVPEFREHEDGYRHVDVHEMTALGDDELDITRALSAFVADGSTEWAVPVHNNSVLVGSEAAVTDAVDIYRGVEGTPETELHARHSDD